MKRIGKLFIGGILVLLFLAIMTVFKIKTGTFSGGFGLIGSILLYGGIMFAFTLIKSSFKEEAEGNKRDYKKIYEEITDSTKETEEAVALKALLSNSMISKEDYNKKLKQLKDNSIKKEKENQEKQFEEKKQNFCFNKNQIIYDFNQEVKLKIKEQIEHLSILKEKGTFTNEEFVRMKNEIKEKCLLNCYRDIGLSVLLNDDVKIIKTGDLICKVGGNENKGNRGAVVFIDNKNLEYFIVRSGYEYRKWNTIDCIFERGDKYFENKFSPSHFDLNKVVEK